MWKLIIMYTPILGAVLIGGSLTIDEYHNWYDVVGGAAIGTTVAFSSYRMTYAAIWDWRFNHIPLNRLGPFSYGQDGTDLVNAVFTRKANWGAYGYKQGKHTEMPGTRNDDRGNQIGQSRGTLRPGSRRSDNIV
jgi:diacylglycerol diphosphate phosphatase / phosphatidate phosphatase